MVVVAKLLCWLWQMHLLVQHASAAACAADRLCMNWLGVCWQVMAPDSAAMSQAGQGHGIPFHRWPSLALLLLSAVAAADLAVQ